VAQAPCKLGAVRQSDSGRHVAGAACGGVFRIQTCEGSRASHPTTIHICCGTVGLALKLAGTYLLESGKYSYGIRITGDFVLTAVGMALPALTWPPLFKLLLAYGYASRIPVAIVQWLALRGHWGTHYDASGNFPPIGFWPTYIRVSLVPNIFFMEAYTVIVGALVGTAALAILEAIKPKST